MSYNGLSGKYLDHQTFHDLLMSHAMGCVYPLSHVVFRRGLACSSVTSSLYGVAGSAPG